MKFGVDKRLKSKVKSQKSKVEYIYKNTLDEEVRHVVAEILHLKKEDTDATWDDFAILVRANSHAEPFIQALERAKIPYEFLSAAGLYRQPIVLDCFAFLKVIDHYHESTAVYRLLCL